MPKIFLIISAVLLLASAGLSFANKSKLAAKNVEITETNAKATAARNDATKAQTAQKATEKSLAEANTKATDLQTQLTASGDQVKDITGKLEVATKSMTDKDTEIADLKTKIAAPTTPGAPVVAVADLQKQVETLTHERDELKVVKDGLDGQLKSAQTQTASLARQIAARANNESMNGLRGQVVAVNHDWNFVVLNLGGRNGVNNSTTMIVQRGGSLVGRVKITSVEPSTSVADIVPNSVPAGIEVRPGDTVVFPGS